MVASPLYATKGIVAGSAFAVGELVAYMLEASNKVLMSFPDLILSIHIDDLSAAIRRKKAQDAAAALQKAAAMLIVEFKIELELPFAPDKAFLIGNNSDVVRLGQKALAKYAGQEGRTVKRLGTDHALDGQSTAGVQVARFAKNWKRKPSIRNIQTKANPQVQVFTCGIVPSVSFGCELTTPPPALLRNMRTWALDVRRQPTSFMNRDVAFAVIGAEHDPACAMHLLCLARYHREWWELPWERRHRDALRPIELTEAYQAALKYYDPNSPTKDAEKTPCQVRYGQPTWLGGPSPTKEL